MSRTKQLLRYRCIDRLLQGGRLVKTKRIKAYLDGRDLGVSLKTITTDIEAMRSDSQLEYFAPIEYDKKQNAWYYTDSEYTLENFKLTREDIQSIRLVLKNLELYSGNWMFEYVYDALRKVSDAVSISESVGDNTELIQLIQVEDKREIIGNQYLPDIIETLEEKGQLRILYCKYEKDAQGEWRIIYPCFLKEYQGRWYVVGVEKQKGVRTFGLDRIQELEQIDEPFSNMVPDFTDYYRDSIGIIVSDSPAEEVLLRFTYKAGQYIKSLPIHSSQKIIKEDEYGVEVGLRIKPNYEFYELLRKFGSDVEVLSPRSVRKRLIKDLKNTIQKYSK